MGEEFWLLTDDRGRPSRVAPGGDPWNPVPGPPSGDGRPLIGGYAGESPHLAYLLDPLYDRHGPGARLWRGKVADPNPVGPNRIAAATWTRLVEARGPAWLGRPVEVPVRLRFCLLATARVLGTAGGGDALGSLDLGDLRRATREVEKVDRACRKQGLFPQATWLALKAFRRAPLSPEGEAMRPSRLAMPYPLYAWFAALAASAACLELDPLADEAVRLEAPTGPLLAVGA